MRTGLTTLLKPGTCRECGCTELSPCVDPQTKTGCYWIDETEAACNACAVILGNSWMEYPAWGAARLPMMTRLTDPQEGLMHAVSEARQGFLIRVCSMCQDPELRMLLSAGALPNVSHGYCDTCCELMMRELEELEKGAAA